MSSLSKTSGYTTGGQTITIRGANFGHVRKVYFGPRPGLNVKVVSPSRLKVVAPALWPARVEVRVETAHGLSPQVKADRYRYLKPPAANASTVAAKDDVATLSPASITAVVKTDAGWAVTVAPGTTVPAVGDKVFATPAPNAPLTDKLWAPLGGWVTKVAGLSDGSTRISISALALDQLVSAYQTSFSGSVTDPAGGAYRRAARSTSAAGSADTPMNFSAMAAKWVTCKSTDPEVADGDVKVDGSAALTFEHMNTTVAVDVPHRRFDAQITMDPTLTLDFSVSGGATCTLNGDKFKLTVHLGSSPLVLEVNPIAAFTITAEAHLHAVLSSHASLSAHMSGGKAPVFDSYFQALPPQLTGSASAKLVDSYVGAHFVVYPEVKVIGLDTTVSFHANGQLDVKGATNGTTGSASVCFSLNTYLEAKAHVFVNVWWAELQSPEWSSGQLFPYSTGTKCAQAVLLEPQASSPPDLTPNTVISTKDPGTGAISWYLVDWQRIVHPIPYPQDSFCWRHLVKGVRAETAIKQPMDPSAVVGLPTGEAKPCIIGPAIVKGDDSSSWYVDGTNTRHSIPDTDTYSVLASRVGADKVYGPFPIADITKSIPGGAAQPHILNVANHSIVRLTNGKSYVVEDGRQVLHEIPQARDDTCWRLVKGYGSIRSGVTPEQLGAADIREPWPCQIPDLVVKSNDGKSYFVDRSNTRYELPDTDTFYAYQSIYGPAVGPWSVGDINNLLVGPMRPHMMNAKPNSVIVRTDGISWMVDSKLVRHHIPYARDLVCWQRKVGYSTASNVAGSEIDTLPPEGNAAPCVIGDAIVKSDDGKSYYVDKTNTRHELPDAETYDAYVTRYGADHVYGPWPAADVATLQAGAPAAHTFSAKPNTIIRRHDGVSYVIDANGYSHHIPYAQDDVCWTDLRKLPVSATGLTDAQVKSVTEKDAWPCIIGDAVVTSDDGKSYYVDKTNKRHLLADDDTAIVVQRRYHDAYGPWPAADIAKLPDGGGLTLVNPIPGTIIRRADGISYVVDANSTIHHIPYARDDTCWRKARNKSVSALGLTPTQTAWLTEHEAWPCVIGDAVVTDQNNHSYWVDKTNARHAIPDTDTYYVDTRAFPGKLYTGWSADDINSLTPGYDQPAKLNVQPNTLVKDTNNVAWRVMSDYSLRQVPYAQDEICWRDKVGLPMTSGVAPSALEWPIVQASQKEPCIIGDTVITDSDDHSWYVDNKNGRHSIPDTDTYAVAVRTWGKQTRLATWPVGDVNAIPKGWDMTPVINPKPNSLIRDSNNVSWKVNSDFSLHRVPSFPDEVCWRDKAQLPWQAQGVAASKIAWPLTFDNNGWCSIGPVLVTDDQNRSFTVGSNNRKRSIPDAETYWELRRRYAAYATPLTGWPAGDLNGLPSDADEGRLMNPDTVKDGVLCKANGQCYYVDTSLVRHYISDWPSHFCTHWIQGHPDKRGGVEDDRVANSFPPEGGGWGCNMQGVMLKASDNAAVYIMTGNTRRWVPDQYSADCYWDQGYNHWSGNAPWSEVSSLPQGPDLGKCLSPTRIRGRTITTQGGYAYVIDGNGVWHYITNNWNNCTNHYPVYARDLPWDQVKANGVFNEGAHADQGWC